MSLNQGQELRMGTSKTYFVFWIAFLRNWLELERIGKFYKEWWQ